MKFNQGKLGDHKYKSDPGQLDGVVNATQLLDPIKVGVHKTVQHALP